MQLRTAMPICITEHEKVPDCDGDFLFEQSVLRGLFPGGVDEEMKAPEEYAKAAKEKRQSDWVSPTRQSWKHHGFSLQVVNNYLHYSLGQ